MKYYITIKYSYHPAGIKKETKTFNLNTSIWAIRNAIESIINYYDSIPEISEIIVRTKP